jgi:hypothetical protein
LQARHYFGAMQNELRRQLYNNGALANELALLSIVGREVVREARHMRPDKNEKPKNALTPIDAKFIIRYTSPLGERHATVSLFLLLGSG